MLRKEKEKFYIITIFAVLTGFVLVWEGIFSSRMAIGRKIFEILDKKASIGAYTQREESLPGVISNYTSTREKIEKVNERFVDGKNSVEVDKFFNELENAASVASVQLEKVFIEDPEVIKKTAKKPAASPEAALSAEDDKFLRLTIKGKYENVLDFIYKLEAMPYFIDIKSVNISTVAASWQDKKKEKDNSDNELQSVVIIKIFKKQDIDDKK